MAVGNFCFSIGILENLNGFQLKSVEPDQNGFYPMVLGCLGIPTRRDVIYDIDSTIRAMKDVTTRFNICLRDGNLCGEYGHPFLTGETEQERRDDIKRLLHIDERFKSHYFGKIWADDNVININGMEALPIRGLVKPIGPYGDRLEKELRDPYHNTAFSIRSLCSPMHGPDKRFEYRKTEIVVTFDTVSAPGFDITSKRYVTGQESFSEIGNVSAHDLRDVISSSDGMESLLMMTDADVLRLYGDQSLTLNGNMIASRTMGSKSILSPEGNIVSAASIAYGRRN